MSDPIEDALIAKVGANPMQTSEVDPVESALVAKLKADANPSSNQIKSTTKPEANKWDSIFHSSASLADTVLGIPGQIIKGVEYAGARAAGEDPNQATQRANSGLGEAMSHPVGDAFGVTNTQGYKNEGSKQITDFISQNIGKGAKWISEQTGLPESDVGNMIQSLSLGTPEFIGMAEGAAGTVGDAAMETAANDMKQAPAELPEWQKVRQTYNEPSTPLPKAPDTPVSQYASGGSAASTVSARLNTATPELQQDVMSQINEAKQKYGDSWQSHINYDAIDRQLNADGLPIPGRLTSGQASGNGAIISDEWNHRNTNGLAPNFAAQNQTQIANLQKIREETAPDVFTNSPDTHAQTLIDSYKALHDQESKVIDDKWNSIRAQSGDKPIFDANQMLSDAQLSLKKNLLSSVDPGGQLAELMAAARERGGLSADGFVSLRQNLGREAMAGGNSGKAASIVLDAINKSEMLSEAAQFRGMVNDALATGRDLHAKLAADPAYDAVANGNASVKDFTNKFIINGKPENVAHMRDNLAGDDVASQTMRSALMDHLRVKSGIDEQYHGEFGSKNFNNNLRGISPVGRVILNNGELGTLQALGDYSNHVTAGGRDSWKNFSNTATELQSPGHAIATTAGNIIGAGVESGLAGVTHGASIPFVSMFKSGAKQRAAIKAELEAQERAEQFKFNSTRPAAGIIKE